MRFDGIFLLAAMLLGAAIYLLVALGAAAVALASRATAPRAWRVAGAAGLMLVATLFIFLILFSYWAASGTAHYGIDWFDLGVFPWVVVFALGCWQLTRVR